MKQGWAKDFFSFKLDSGNEINFCRATLFPVRNSTFTIIPFNL